MYIYWRGMHTNGFWIVLGRLEARGKPVWQIFHFTFSPLSTVGEVWGSLLAVTPHQHLGMENSHLISLSDANVRKNILRVLLVWFWQFSDIISFNAHVLRKYFWGLFADQVHSGAFPGPGTCYRAWPGEWSNLLSSPPSVQALHILCWHRGASSHFLHVYMGILNFIGISRQR